MWMIMAALSALFAGLTSILAKCGIKKTDPDVATALRTVVVLLFSWIMVFVVGSAGTITEISAGSWDSFSVKIMKKSGLSLTATIKHF